MWTYIIKSHKLIFSAKIKMWMASEYFQQINGINRKYHLATLNNFDECKSNQDFTIVINLMLNLFIAFIEMS